MNKEKRKDGENLQEASFSQIAEFVRLVQDIADETHLLLLKLTLL
ncbi:MAG: hypothetical protein ACI35P_00310 [Bacillus sp. (in: firmicutes)]